MSGRGNGLVNIVGLSLAFASSLIIYLWSYGELNKDGFHEADDRIYGVYSRVIYPGGIQTSINTPAKLPAELKAAIPEIEYATGFAKSFRLSLQGVTAETFQRDDIILKMKGSRASPQFFNIFSFKILQGDKENALLKPDGIAISRRMANARKPADKANTTTPATSNAHRKLPLLVLLAMGKPMAATTAPPSVVADKNDFRCPMGGA